MSIGRSGNLADISDADFMLYMAVIVRKLNSWKFTALPHLPRDVLMKHPCGIDGFSIEMEAVRRTKPELLEGDRPLHDIFREVDKYLYGRRNKGVTHDVETEETADSDRGTGHSDSC